MMIGDSCVKMKTERVILEKINYYFSKTNMIENKKLILLVEDDIFVKDIYNHKLTADGYEVAMVGSGTEALEFMEKRKPDLILLDIVMPYMDGKEALGRIKEKEEWKKIPIIMLTNLSEAEDINETESLGADKYLIKSHFSPSEVSEKIKLMMGEGKK